MPCRARDAAGAVLIGTSGAHRADGVSRGRDVSGRTGHGGKSLHAVIACRTQVGRGTTAQAYLIGTSAGCPDAAGAIVAWLALDAGALAGQGVVAGGTLSRVLSLGACVACLTLAAGRGACRRVVACSTGRDRATGGVAAVVARGTVLAVGAHRCWDGACRTGGGRGARESYKGACELGAGGGACCRVGAQGTVRGGRGRIHAGSACSTLSACGGRAQGVVAGGTGHRSRS